MKIFNRLFRSSLRERSEPLSARSTLYMKPNVCVKRLPPRGCPLVMNFWYVEVPFPSDIKKSFF